MKVAKEHIINLTYELRDPDRSDELLERMDANYPFIFLFGAGKLLPAFEEQLEGLEEGDQFDFILLPEQAYGPIQPANILRLSRKDLQLEDLMTLESIQPGNYINLTDDLGQQHQGKILDLDEEYIQVDFNHAMAGKKLRFTGTVLLIRKASIDELIRQHYIQEDGIHRDSGENS
ncbi:MAG: FKBP-type peptidyl-prolyl cis-trans isomerase [Bacteroidota bacterium]